VHRQSPKFLRYNHDQPKPAGIDQTFERGTKNTTKDGRQINGDSEKIIGYANQNPKMVPEFPDLTWYENGA